MSVHRLNKKEQTEESSYPKSIEVLLREAARKSYPDPENVDNPVIAPGDYELCQSVRVLVLQNKDRWIRPTDLSWCFPILVTIREFALQNFIVEGQLRIWKPGMKPRSRKRRKTKQSDQTQRDTTWQSPSYWQ